MARIKAAYFTHNKSFEVTETDHPPVGPDEVEIDVAFCGICGTDLHIYHGAMPHRLGDRRVLGHEMSGTVAAVGAEVQGLTVGQKAVVRPLDHCGTCPACVAGHTHICQNLKFLGIDTDGGFAEKWTVPAHTVHALPESIDLKDAALIEPLAVACHDVSRADLKPGEDVLVIGGGPIGILVAYAAKAAGGKVVMTEVNPNRIEKARALGFEVLDPTAVDLKETLFQATGTKGMDVVFEVSGSKAGVKTMTEVAAVRGRIVMVAIHAEPPEVDMFQFFWRELTLFGARVYRPEAYDAAIAMIAAGEIDTQAMITDIAPLDGIQAAFAALDDNPTAMKSLIQIRED